MHGHLGPAGVRLARSDHGGLRTLLTTLLSILITIGFRGNVCDFDSGAASSSVVEKIRNIYGLE